MGPHRRRRVRRHQLQAPGRQRHLLHALQHRRGRHRGVQGVPHALPESLENAQGSPPEARGDPEERRSGRADAPRFRPLARGAREGGLLRALQAPSRVPVPRAVRHVRARHLPHVHRPTAPRVRRLRRLLRRALRMGPARGRAQLAHRLHLVGQAHPGGDLRLRPQHFRRHVEPDAQQAPRDAPEGQARHGPRHHPRGGLLRHRRRGQSPPRLLQGVGAAAGVDVRARHVRRAGADVLDLRPPPEAGTAQEKLRGGLLDVPLARRPHLRHQARARVRLGRSVRLVLGRQLDRVHVPLRALLHVAHAPGRGAQRQAHLLGELRGGSHRGHQPEELGRELAHGVPQLPGDPSPLPGHAAVSAAGGEPQVRGVRGEVEPQLQGADLLRGVEGDLLQPRPRGAALLRQRQGQGALNNKFNFFRGPRAPRTQPLYSRCR
mmetsp:Transcript_9375/g.36471  ORF Transcript_9375/g.36471 Transcript_9375/m.36471 type:complete len:434 (+) Transcript_9375:273-1574(+)